MRDDMDPALRAKIGAATCRSRRAISSRSRRTTSRSRSTRTSTTGGTWRGCATSRTPSPIRRGPLLYNIWDIAHRGHGDRDGGDHAARRALRRPAALAGNHVDHARAARRARARLAATRRRTSSTSSRPRPSRSEFTPRGWMRPDLDLLGFEQQLYLRQPGYGTSYVTGKYLLEDLMRVRAQQLGRTSR